MEFKIISSIERILETTSDRQAAEPALKETKQIENQRKPAAGRRKLGEAWLSETHPALFKRIFIFGVFEGDESSFLKNKNLKKFDFIYKRLKQLDFKAKRGKSALIESPILSLVHGLGKKNKFSYDSIRYFVSSSLKIAKTNKIKEAVFIIPELSEEYRLENGLLYVSSAIVEGALLGLYEFKKYKTKDGEINSKSAGDFKLVRVYFDAVKIDKNRRKKIKEGFNFGKITSQAANFARDIANEPGNVATPEYLANIAREISVKEKMWCEVFDEKEIVERGMLSFYGVAQGSKNPPRFIHLIYKPKSPKSGTKKENIKKIAIVGKGVTFDSGGLSLKPADFMTTMKSDKSGACAVLGVMKYIPDLDLDIEIHGIIAACENMPDGGAQRPDDIVKALNGKTIEIENTDAEGRLTLADALTFAENQGVKEIIDMATLTGACVVALGEYTSGVMGNDEGLMNSIIKTSLVSGERMWKLPFDDNMKEKLSSPVADVKNVGNKYGGAITAGMFLEEFVSEKVKWCHIDIAGPAFTKTGFTYNPKGATGVGVRTMLYYLTQDKV